MCRQPPGPQSGHTAQVVADLLPVSPGAPPGTPALPLPPGAGVSSLQVQIFMIIYTSHPANMSWAGPRSNLLASEIQIDLIRIGSD